jgi:hypothetical protein
LFNLKTDGIIFLYFISETEDMNIEELREYCISKPA